MDVLADMFDRCETAPGDDLLEILRPVQFRFEFLVAAAPIGNADMPGQRMVWGHVDHGAGDGGGGERVIGRRFDQRIAAQDHVAHDGQQRQSR
ncbi:hypothetical protein D9M71_804430 [compost metagenome]